MLVVAAEFPPTPQGVVKPVYAASIDEAIPLLEQDLGTLTLTDLKVDGHPIYRADQKQFVLLVEVQAAEFVAQMIEGLTRARLGENPAARLT
jgi:hypothetical protein